MIFLQLVQGLLVSDVQFWFLGWEIVVRAASLVSPFLVLWD
jgi:hypothetical protein